MESSEQWPEPVRVPEGSERKSYSPSNPFRPREIYKQTIPTSTDDSTYASGNSASPSAQHNTSSSSNSDQSSPPVPPSLKPSLNVDGEASGTSGGSSSPTSGDGQHNNVPHHQPPPKVPSVTSDSSSDSARSDGSNADSLYSNASSGSSGGSSTITSVSSASSGPSSSGSTGSSSNKENTGHQPRSPVIPNSHIQPQATAPVASTTSTAGLTVASHGPRKVPDSYLHLPLPEGLLPRSEKETRWRHSVEEELYRRIKPAAGLSQAMDGEYMT